MSIELSLSEVSFPAISHCTAGGDDEQLAVTVGAETVAVAAAALVAAVLPEAPDDDGKPEQERSPHIYIYLESLWTTVSIKK